MREETVLQPRHEEHDLEDVSDCRSHELNCSRLLEVTAHGDSVEPADPSKRTVLGIIDR